MYKDKFKLWGKEFKKNTGKKNARPHCKKRSRAAAGLPKKHLRYANSVIQPIPKMLSLEQTRMYEEMLHAIGDCVKSLFDTAKTKTPWGWDEFGITIPYGVFDCSNAWRNMTEECYGAAWLTNRRHIPKMLASIEKVRGTLAETIREHEPWMFVYLWRVILIVRSISHHLVGSLPHHLKRSPPHHLRDQLPKQAFLPDFLRYLRELVQQRFGNSHALVGFLSTLNRVPDSEFSSSFGVIYWRIVDGFSQFLGPRHPVVLSMVTYFLRYWKGSGKLDTDVYKVLISKADRELGKAHTSTIILHTDYMSAVYKHGNDFGLAYDLALDLWTQMNLMMPRDLDCPPNWSHITDAYFSASMFLARIHRERGQDDDSWIRYLRKLAIRLQGGDDNCRRSAAQAQETMALWLRFKGETEQSKLEEKLAEKIRETLPDVSLDHDGWASNCLRQVLAITQPKTVCLKLPPGKSFRSRSQKRKRSKRLYREKRRTKRREEREKRLQVAREHTTDMPHPVTSLL
jgi:hypothetical protein